jgi:hypothetical protein
LEHSEQSRALKGIKVEVRRLLEMTWEGMMGVKVETPPEKLDSALRDYRLGMRASNVVPKAIIVPGYSSDD